MSLFARLLLAAALLFAPAIARAADSADLAKKAQADLAAGHYLTAAAEWEESYRLAPDSALLFSIGQAYRLGGDAEKALGYYQRYLGVVSRGRKRAEAQKWVKSLERELRARNSPPTHDALTTAPPPRSVAQRPTAEATVVARARAILATEPALPGARAAVEAGGPTRMEWIRGKLRWLSWSNLSHRWWFWGAVGVVAAGALAGATYGIYRAVAPPEFPDIGPAASSALVHLP